MLPWFKDVPRPRSGLVQKAVRQLALLSYSLYLANNEVSLLLRHPKVATALGLQNNFPLAVALFLALTLIISLVVNRWIERPFLHLRDRKVPQLGAIAVRAGNV